MKLEEEVKNYCRTDEDLTTYIEAAKLYLKNAGAKVDEENSLFCLAVKMLVAHWYDNRGAVGTVTKKLEYGLNAIIEQLKYCYERKGEG